MKNKRTFLLALLITIGIFTPVYSDETRNSSVSIRFGGIDLSYGKYSGYYTNSSSNGDVSGSFSASQPNIGIGASLRFPSLGMPENYYCDLGYHYNFSSGGLTVSYIYFDAIGTKDNIYGGVGINYSFWNQDISGGLGLQALAGLSFSERLLVGIKYLTTVGTKSTSEYDNSYVLSQILLDCRFNF